MLVALSAFCFLIFLTVLSLSIGAVHATDCPPGSYSDCVAAVSGPWNPLVPVIGAVAGAGIAGLFAGGKPDQTKSVQFGKPGGPISDVDTGGPPMSPPPMQVIQPDVIPSTTSATTPGPDSLPEGPIRKVTVSPTVGETDTPPPVQQGPVNLPENPMPPRTPIFDNVGDTTMQSPSVYGKTSDGAWVRIPSNIQQPIGGAHGDKAPGDGRYEDWNGDPVGAPIGMVLRSETVRVGPMPGLGTSHVPDLDAVFYGGGTIPLPGAPDTPENENTTVHYRKIVYDDPRTNTRYSYTFWRNEGGNKNPFITDGAYRLWGPPKVGQIPK